MEAVLDMALTTVSSLAESFAPRATNLSNDTDVVDEKKKMAVDDVAVNGKHANEADQGAEMEDVKAKAEDNTNQ